MKLFEKQLLHSFALLILLIGSYSLTSYGPVVSGQFLNLNTETWFWISILSPVIHVIYVWFFWRMELYYSYITKLFGKNGFTLYSIGFAILILSRLITIIFLSISNNSSFYLDSAMTYLISALLLVPSAYLGYSLSKYFGIKRAFGIDHFDESYRSTPFVKQGIFKYTSNGMYIYGMLILWIPGILLHSYAALIAAAFNHIAIWIHYYCTELPDIKYIYGNSDK